MWRRTYLLLILVRLYFALSPSYIHPDENFQGPEVIAGKIFNYPVRLSWEFTTGNPIRSIFSLWPVYGLPMLLLRWLWMGDRHNGDVSPKVVFWTLRIIMFALSFVLEDWALHELVPSPRHRKVVVLLVASSYATWTYQTHTFSNSIETLAVTWSLVLIRRILENKKRSSTFTSAALGSLVVFGIFNRITFPAFLLIPGIRLITYYVKRPFALMAAILSALITSFIAILFDTWFYTEQNVTWSYLLSHPVVTPINNFMFNFSKTNLAKHGLHPWYQHTLFNLPQLIGPVLILLLVQPKISLRLYSAFSGIFILSLFEHQEARFLLPTIPLILSSVDLPKIRFFSRLWIILWICFNVFFGILMGVYHQGGVVPTQLFLSDQPNSTHAIWWKTYSPPVWLLGGKNKELVTHDLMGIEGSLMIDILSTFATCRKSAVSRTATKAEENTTYLIAPTSAIYLDKYISNQELNDLRFHQVWTYKKHINLDDLNISEDGFWTTIQRVIVRRGITAWKVTKHCSDDNKS